jgi:cell division protein FtsW
LNKESPDGRNKGARPASSGNPKVNVVKRPTGLVKSGARPLTRSEKKDVAWERGEKSIVRTRGGVDRPMLAIILILIALGTVMVFSASYPNAYIYENDSMFYLKKQLFFVAIGGVLMAIASIIP